METIVPDQKLTLVDIIVTPEMIAAGKEAFEAVGEIETEGLVEIIYRAMAVEAPIVASEPERVH